jgi:hypothetical protein
MAIPPINGIPLKNTTAPASPATPITKYGDVNTDLIFPNLLIFNSLFLV